MLLYFIYSPSFLVASFFIKVIVYAVKHVYSTGSFSTCFNEIPFSKETKDVVHVFVDRWSLKQV